jgi:Ca2+:H+ antiporter
MFTFRADAIKRAARKEAWLGDGESRYNPFGRLVRPQRPQHDEETGLHPPLARYATENNAPSPIELRRRLDGRPTSSGLQHPATFPPETYPPGQAGELPETEPHQSERGDEITASSNGSTERPLVSSSLPQEKAPEGEIHQSVGPENGARKRKSRMHLPWKKSKDEEPTQDMERTDTSETKKSRPKLTVMSQFKAVMGSWINLLLIFVPAGIALGNTNVNGVIVFVINFIAIIPLAAMLSYSTEELAMYIGETLGGLLNATFGNAVELIVGIIALVKGEVLIVRETCHGNVSNNRSLTFKPPGPNITRWEYALKSTTRHGHVLLLRWAQANRAVFQPDRGSNRLITPGSGDWLAHHTYGLCAVCEYR